MNLSDYEVRAVKDSSKYGTRAQLYCTRCRDALVLSDDGSGHLGWPSFNLAAVVAAANLHALDNHERTTPS